MVDAQPVTIPPGKEKEFFRGDQTVYLPPSSRLFRNEPLRLRCRPDGVVSAGGAVEPIEIKSRGVRPSDEIELALYWRLLEPRRSVEATPAGWVFLRSPDGSMTERRIEIPAVVFVKLDSGDQRRPRSPDQRSLPEPVLSFRGLRRRKAGRGPPTSGRAAQDVSTMMGVGRSYAAALRACGVDCWTSLLAADPDVLAYKVRFEDSKCKAVSADLVRRWQAHARALLHGDALWVGLPQEFPIPSSYIALDLEYIPETKEV